MNFIELVGLKHSLTCIESLDENHQTNEPHNVLALVCAVLSKLGRSRRKWLKLSARYSQHIDAADNQLSEIKCVTLAVDSVYFGREKALNFESLKSVYVTNTSTAGGNLHAVLGSSFCI